MISRFPGLTPTRGRAVVHDGLVFTVAVAPDPVTSSMYEQTVKALGRIDESSRCAARTRAGSFRLSSTSPT
jgi:hypothetical protein